MVDRYKTRVKSIPPETAHNDYINYLKI